ncbi:MAG: hypothetical protein HYV35_12580 [Lentisphaerae bacterium]|nr:hypothetical protein [Lentisphaerota bacterium]
MASINIRTMAPDLIVPPVTDEPPAPGRRVRRALDGFTGTRVYHTLFLPTNWNPARRFPVIVEYPGNGPYVSALGDVCSGEVEDCALGYGLSAGRDFIWIGLPFINREHTGNERYWWGDVAMDVDYCCRAVRQVCQEFGGDQRAVFLTGFSRGAIACNYIGLHNDAIAGLWCAFLPHSHYDGVVRRDYPASDRAAALMRLRRLNGRPSLITQERTDNPSCALPATRSFLETSGVQAPFTFMELPFHNHCADWLLRALSEREQVRAWVQRVRHSASERA